MNTFSDISFFKESIFLISESAFKKVLIYLVDPLLILYNETYPE